MSPPAENARSSSAPARGGDIVHLFPHSSEREPPAASLFSFETHGPRIALRDQNERRSDSRPGGERRGGWARARRDAALVEQSQERDASVWMVCAVAFAALAMGFFL